MLTLQIGKQAIPCRCTKGAVRFDMRIFEDRASPLAVLCSSTTALRRMQWQLVVTLATYAHTRFPWCVCVRACVRACVHAFAHLNLLQSHGSSATRAPSGACSPTLRLLTRAARSSARCSACADRPRIRAAALRPFVASLRREHLNRLWNP